MKKNILFIGGSLNQTMQMHKISEHLKDYNLFFTPYYSDGYIRALTKMGMLDFTVLGGEFKRKTIEYLEKHNLQIDYEGKSRNYDLVFTCQDLIIPKNIRNSRVVLVQEGMTDPENLWYHIVKNLNLPRWAASTSMTGLSDLYDVFCVASEGYKELFIKKGVKPEKIRVTGIPNFDNVKEILKLEFEHDNFVLVATSDMRETFKYENRKKFIRKAQEIANGRKLIFKLHPNENFKKREAEIKKYAPEALVYYGIPIEPLIAHCDVLVTRYSSVVYLALALGKEVHSDIDIETLMRLLPIQNDGTSAKYIAEEGRKLLEFSNKREFVSFYVSFWKSFRKKKLLDSKS
jgi:hypothetical protein